MIASESAVTTRRKNASHDAFEILNRVLKVANSIRTRLAEFLEPFDLNEVRHSVLTVLKEAGTDGLSQSDLAVYLGQSESNISTLIERMQHDGLVSRIRSDADRRKWVLQLSPAGRLLLDRIESVRNAWAEKTLSGLSEIDRVTLGSLAKHLDSSLTNRAPKPVEPSTSPLDDTLREISEWAGQGHSSIDPEEVRTPHAALQEMLTALGLVSQLVEDRA